MKIIMAILDSYPEALDLRSDLVERGFSRDNINIVRNEAEREKGFVRRIEELFGAGEVPKELRDLYAEGVRRGGVLVTMETDDRDADKAVGIMGRHGAINIEKRAGYWREMGWKGFDEKARPYTPEETIREWKFLPVGKEAKDGESTGNTGRVRVYSHASERPEEKTRFRIEDEDFRNFYDSLSISDREKEDNFDEYWSAYSYSRKMSKQKRYEGKHWPDVEEDVHKDWEMKHPGTWGRFKDTIRQGWEARH